jgi:adenylosuccinate lyase
MLPETFLISDELLSTTIKIINGLRVNEESISRNLKTYGPFAALERVLMALGKAGADRQIMHERLREHAMEAWKAVQQGFENPMTERLVADPDILQYLDLDHLRELMEVGQYLGDAALRAHQLATTINSYLKENSR